MAEAETERFLADLPPAIRNHARIIVEEGGPDEVIARAVDRVKPDLVVLGTHGVGGFIHAAVGSTAASLLTWIAQDTLVVRAPGRED
ncbi:MAG: universal stress protein [Sphingobium sp.]